MSVRVTAVLDTLLRFASSTRMTADVPMAIGTRIDTVTTFSNLSKPIPLFVMSNW